MYEEIKKKEAIFKNGTQEKLECLCFSDDSSLCFGGSKGIVKKASTDICSFGTRFLA
jgi:hypothetical protein